jgi:O-antigen/teichoic acid export membrane protein
MNLPQKIFANTVAYTIANLSTRFGNILITLIMARTLHATGVGIYATAMAYFGIIDEATNMGATTFLVREIAKKPGQTNRYVAHFSIMGTLFAAMGLVLVWAVLPYFGYSNELTTSLYIIVLAIIPGTLNMVQSSVFVAHQKVKFITYTTFVSSVLTLGLSYYLLRLGYGVVGLIVIFVVIQYLVMMIYFYFINRYITRLKWEFEFAVAWQMLREIKTFAALSILGALFAQPEIIILSLLATEAQIGYYSAAMKVIGLWQFIPQIYMSNVYPVLSHSFYVADQKFQIIQEKSIKYLLAVAFPLTIGIVAGAKSITNLLFGPGFEEAVVPMQILAWTIPIFFVSSVLWRVLAARDQENSVLWARIITVFTRLGGGFALIAVWTLLGATISTVANLLLNTLLLGLYDIRNSNPLRYVSQSWRFGLAALVMGAFIWVFSPLVSFWILIPLAGTSYVMLVLLFKAFSVDDFALFRQIWQPQTARKGL